MFGGFSQLGVKRDRLDCLTVAGWQLRTVPIPILHGLALDGTLLLLLLFRLRRPKPSLEAPGSCTWVPTLEGLASAGKIS